MSARQIEGSSLSTTQKAGTVTITFIIRLMYSIIQNLEFKIYVV